MAKLRIVVTKNVPTATCEFRFDNKDFLRDQLDAQAMIKADTRLEIDRVLGTHNGSAPDLDRTKIERIVKVVLKAIPMCCQGMDDGCDDECRSESSGCCKGLQGYVESL